MIEHVPLLRRDTESSMNDPPSMRVPPSGRKHGRSDSDIAQPLERSVDLADGKDDIDHHSDITIRSTIFDRAAQASGGGWGRVKPKPKPQKPPPQATAREDLSELQARHDCWSGESVYPAISIRDAQDSADSYGPCARPKNKVLPTKATVKTDASDQQLSPNHHDDMTTHSAIAARYTSGSFDLPGKPCRGNKPCYCHPPVVASKSELKTAEIQPRRMRDKCNGHPCLLDRPRFGPPAVASRSESKRTEIQPRDVNCCNGRPCLIHRPFYCARGGTSKLESKTTEIQPRRIPCQPCSSADPFVLDRDETVPEGKYKQRSNLYALSECPCGNSKRDDKPDGTGIQDTRIADVMAVLNSRDNLTMVNNATGIAPKNATKIDHDVQKAMYTAQAGVLVLYAVMVVTGLCFTLLFFICIRHCCIRRHRRNALASRRTSYPYKPEISQIESRPNAPTNGSTRMNRIDEEVGEEDVAPQPMTTLDGANDGWTRWLLQKRDVRIQIMFSIDSILIDCWFTDSAAQAYTSNSKASCSSSYSYPEITSTNLFDCSQG